MKATDVINPTPIKYPIAYAGLKNTIPLAATGSNLASITEGFPEMTMKSLADGGLPPYGQDFNGLFYMISDQKAFFQDGGYITFDSTVSTLIGGYPSGAILDYYNPSTNYYTKVESLIDDNTYDFVTTPSYIDGTKWRYVDFGTGANEDLSNLSVYGDARLHALKGYLDSGELLTDAEGLQYVIDYAHSTFDRSKFTVVGSPIVTDDGIASGFSSSNYLRIQQLDFTGKDFKINFKFTVGSTPLAGYVFCDSVTPNNFCLWYWSNSGSAPYSVGLKINGVDVIKKTSDAYELNSTYEGCISRTGDYYHLWYKDVNTGVVRESTTTNSDYAQTSIITTLNIGYSNFGGSIDLKQFSIKVGGVPVFSGNKTGIDTIKANDYTVVGSPTISADGIASGFSGSNYLTTTLSQSLTLDKVDIWNSFTSSSATSGSEIILAITSDTQLVNTVLQVALNRSTGQIQIGCHNDTTWGGHNSSNNTINSLTKYYYHVYYKDGYIKLDLSTDGITYNNVINDAITVSSSFASSKIYIGSISQSTNYLQGSIDLNAFKIYVDGDLVYQPCLKIPYTESADKYGSKIVNGVYRDRVLDAWEQNYLQRYYTLDEANGNFTLPCGEIYGDIERCLNVETPTSDEINTVIGWGMPDYANRILAGTSLNTVVNYTAPSKGWIETNLAVFGGTTYVDVNNVRVAVCTSVGADAYLLNLPTFIPVNKGDVINAFSPYTSTSYAPNTVYFYPCKGV